MPNLALFFTAQRPQGLRIEALELPKGKVITTPFTFASTTHAIVRKGLTPVFADVRESDLTLDPDAVEAAITPRTCAIVPVHVYGNLCDVDAIKDIADRHGLAVVYDAAHAFGVERRSPGTGEWESSASFGDASMFSFHATKVSNTIGEGAVTFPRPRALRRPQPVEELRHHGPRGRGVRRGQRQDERVLRCDGRLQPEAP